METRIIIDPPKGINEVRKTLHDIVSAYVKKNDNRISNSSVGHSKK